MPDPAPLAVDRLPELEDALARLRLASDAAAVDALEAAVRALRRRVNSLVLLGAAQPAGQACSPGRI